jgi:hypothetical protein
MTPQPEGALKETIARADRLIAQGDLEQANALLLDAKASLTGTSGAPQDMPAIIVRLGHISLQNAIRQALDAQRWSEALEQTNQLPPGDAAAETLRREAYQGMAQLLRRQATAAEAKSDWAGAIALLSEAQTYDAGNELLAARITDDQRMLE